MRIVNGAEIIPIKATACADHPTEPALVKSQAIFLSVTSRQTSHRAAIRSLASLAATGTEGPSVTDRAMSLFELIQVAGRT